jgi:hypothetical protein
MPPRGNSTARAASGSTPAPAWAEQYLLVRRTTEELCADISPEHAMLQHQELIVTDFKNALWSSHLQATWKSAARTNRHRTPAELHWIPVPALLRGRRLCTMVRCTPADRIRMGDCRKPLRFADRRPEFSRVGQSSSAADAMAVEWHQIGKVSGLRLHSPGGRQWARPRCAVSR